MIAGDSRATSPQSLRTTFWNCGVQAGIPPTMAYSTQRRCPADHPVAVPAIEVIFRYPIAGGPDVTLSSGGRYSAHADFFNAWNQGVLVRLVNRCLNALRHCGHGE
jgi:hypothetical protein